MGSFLTAAEAAARLGVTRGAFARLARDGTVRQRNDAANGPARFWPEEIDLLALRWRAREAPVDTPAPLLALAQSLASLGDAGAIADTATRFAALLTGAGHAALLLLDSDRDPPVLRRIAAVNPAHPDRDTTVDQWEIPGWDDIVRDRRPLVVAAAAADPRFAPELVARFGLRGLIVVPLTAGDEVIGALVVTRWPEGAEPNPDQLPTLAGMADLVAVALAHARYAKAAQRRAEHLALLNQVGRVLSCSLDVDELCAGIHAEIGGVLAVDAFYVALYEEGDAQVWYPYLVDSGQHCPPNWMPLGDGPTSRALRSRTSVVVGASDHEAATEGPGFGQEDRPSTSALHVPMLHGDRLIGVLSVQSYAPAAYDADDLRTLETLAHQAAAAFAHARLYAATLAGRDEAERHAANLEGVLATTRSIAAAADLGTTLDVLAGELTSLVPHDEVTLYRLTADGQELRSVLNRRGGLDINAAPRILRVGDGLIGGAVANGSAERVNDAHLDPRSVYRGDEAATYAAGEHVVVAPLTVAGQVIGALHLCRLGGEPFTRDEFALFRVLAEQAAVAVRNATLLADANGARARTELHAANLEAVLATTRAITAQVDLRDTLGALTDHLDRLIPHERSMIHRLDPDGRFVPLFGRCGGRPWTQEGTIPPGRGVIGRVASAGEPALINDAHLAPEVYYPTGYPRPAAEHLLAAPLTSGGQTIGAMTLSRSGDSRFTVEDFAVFQVLAAQAGVALHASLLFDEERRRRRHATVLVGVAAALNGAGSLDDLVRHLAAAAADAVGVDRCSLYVYDQTATRTIASAIHGGGDPAPDVGAELPPTALPVERELLATGLPVVGERLAALLAEQETYNVRRQRGGAVLPLRVRGAVQGAMYVWSSGGAARQRPREFDADELALLEAIGDHAGVAIERARLQATTERQLSELRLLGGVNEAIARSLDIETVARETLRRVHDVIPFRAGMVTMETADAAALRVVAAEGEDAAGMDGLLVPIAGSFNGAVFRAGEARTGEFDDGQPYFNPSPSPVVGRYVVCVPLTVDDRVVGTLYVRRDTPGPFAAEDVALFRLLAGQLGVGIERARMFELTLAARERSEYQTRNLEIVLANSQALALQSDLESTLATFSEGVSRLVPYSGCGIFRANLGAAELRLVHDRVLEGPPIGTPRLSFAEGITGDAARRREALCVAHAETDPRVPMARYDAATRAIYRAQGVHVMAVPLLVEGVLLGVLAINRLGPEPFTDEEFAAVRVYAGHAAAAVRNAELLVRNRDLYLAGIRALASAVDAKDPSTRGHSERVSRHAGRIAAAMRLDRETIERVELAGLLHDIGKIGIPDAILQKPGPLDDAERATMMGHAALGAAILAGAGTDALLPLVPLVRHHHEWVNGGGYPDGLAGNDTPLGAAIIAVADAFDTMVTDRPYRARRPVAEAVVELRRAAAAQFRPDVVEALAALLTTDPATFGASPPAWAVAPATSGRLPGTVPDEPLVAAGQMGDARALGLLVELATVTRHIPDLQEFVNQVTGIVRRRLDYQDVSLLLVDRDRNDLVLAATNGQSQATRLGYRQPLDVGILGAVARTGRARNVPDVTRDPLFFADWPDPSGAELVVPLIVDDETIGVINVESSRVAAFTAADEAVLTAVAGQVAAAVHVAQLHDAAKRAAATDGLTGVANHRAFYEALDAATAAVPDGRPVAGNRLSVLLMDVEGLKQVNDTAGHLAGDALLRRVADMIRRHVRDGDVVARYGGDEFAVIMRGAGYDDATRVAAGVRRALLDATGFTRDLGTLRPTVRYGVATLPADGTRGPDLVAIADARLYEMRARTATAHPSLLAGD